MSTPYRNFCCPHCGGVIFYTDTVDPTKMELDNSKVSYPEKDEHCRRMFANTHTLRSKIPHEQVTNIVTGSWKILFTTKRKTCAINPEWLWWRK